MIVRMLVMMTMVAVMLGMRAPLGGLDQPSFKVGDHQRFHRCVRLSSPHLNAVLGKNGQRPLANAAGDDHLNVLFAQPSRERPGLVLGGGQNFGAQDGFCALIHFDQREVPAAAEM